jgi:hypothetical protein
MKLSHRRRFLHLAAAAMALPPGSVRLGAGLPVATGALCRWISARRRYRHFRALGESVVVLAARSALHH